MTHTKQIKAFIRFDRPFRCWKATFRRLSPLVSPCFKAFLGRKEPLAGGEGGRHGPARCARHLERALSRVSGYPKWGKRRRIYSYSWNSLGRWWKAGGLRQEDMRHEL